MQEQPSTDPNQPNMTTAVDPAEFYIALVHSRDISQECRLLIGPDQLELVANGTRWTVSYGDILQITQMNETVHIALECDTYVFSRMGRSCAWFHGALLEAYYRRTLETLLFEGSCIIQSHGQFSLTENRIGARPESADQDMISLESEEIASDGEIMVYPDAIYLLPPSSRARRLPLAFLEAIQKVDQSLTLSFISGEMARLSMLGRSLDPMEHEILLARKAIHQANEDVIRKILPRSREEEIRKASRCLPQGLAIPINTIGEISGALLISVNTLIEKSRMSETFPVIRNIASMGRACVGILELPPDPEGKMQYALWVVAPAEEDRVAVVELAFPDEQAATYVFCVRTSFDHFVTLLNRAFEATGFSRELLTMTDEELASQSREKERMLMIRTPSVRAIRRRFSSRVIHRSLDTWKTHLTDACRAASSSRATDSHIAEDIKRPRPDEIIAGECEACHAVMEPGLRFCRVCGAKAGGTSTPALRFCRNCGEKTHPGANCCSRCGQPLG